MQKYFHVYMPMSSGSLYFLNYDILWSRVGLVLEIRLYILFAFAARSFSSLVLPLKLSIWKLTVLGWVHGQRPLGQQSSTPLCTSLKFLFLQVTKECHYYCSTVLKCTFKVLSAATLLQLRGKYCTFYSTVFI